MKLCEYLDWLLLRLFYSHTNSRQFDIPNRHSSYAKLVNPSDGSPHRRISQLDALLVREPAMNGKQASATVTHSFHLGYQSLLSFVWHLLTVHHIKAESTTTANKVIL
jgi:hypothetical protein